MLKSLSLTLCASLLAFAGPASAAGNKLKLTCHHGAFAMYQVEMDTGAGSATISERIKKQWVPSYKNAKLMANAADNEYVILGQAKTSQACGAVNEELVFTVGQDANKKGVHVGSASRVYSFSKSRCKLKAPPPDLADTSLSLTCK